MPYSRIIAQIILERGMSIPDEHQVVELHRVKDRCNQSMCGILSPVSILNGLGYCKCKI